MSVFFLLFAGERSLEPRDAENENAEGGCPECMTTVLYASCAPPAEDARADPEAARHRPGGEDSAVKDGSGAIRVTAHAWPLATPPPPAPGGGTSRLQVLVAGSGRSLPGAKHSSWLRDRKPLDELKAQVRIRSPASSAKLVSVPNACHVCLYHDRHAGFFSHLNM